MPNVMPKVYTRNPYSTAQNSYNAIEVSNSSPVDLVIKLYDGAVNFLSKAVLEIQDGKKGQIDYINKTVAIIEELLSALKVDVGGEVALNLRELYVYMLMELTKANATNDTKSILKIQGLLKTLMDGWVEVREQGITGLSRRVAIKS
ncbi:MAG: flagellar export chaperone FliS [Nitrospirae bacterium]|nr:flagellar export chaperone FliS [Nitrospirota bacterium]